MKTGSCCRPSQFLPSFLSQDPHLIPSVATKCQLLSSFPSAYMSHMTIPSWPPCPYFSLYPSPQLQQAATASPEHIHARKPGRLPTDLIYSLCSLRSSPLVSTPSLKQNSGSLAWPPFPISLDPTYILLLSFLSLLFVSSQPHRQLQQATLLTHEPLLAGKQVSWWYIHTSHSALPDPIQSVSPIVL